MPRPRHNGPAPPHPCAPGARVRGMAGGAAARSPCLHDGARAAGKSRHAAPHSATALVALLPPVVVTKAEGVIPMRSMGVDISHGTRLSVAALRCTGRTPGPDAMLAGGRKHQKQAGQSSQRPQAASGVLIVFTAAVWWRGGGHPAPRPAPLRSPTRPRVAWLARPRGREERAAWASRRAF